MARRTPQDWIAASDENLRAARTLERSGSRRSATSRAWYSAMSTVHAILIHLGTTPPDRGNWSNHELPALLWRALAARDRRNGEWIARAKILRNDLAKLWGVRLLADYDPTSVLDERIARLATRTAGQLDQLWKEMQ